MNALRASLLAPVAAALLALQPAAATVLTFDVNLTVPDNGIGLYVNFIDGTTFSGPSTFPTVGGPGGNYDFNLFGGTTSWSLFPPGTTGQSAPTPVPGTSKGYVAASVNGLPVALAPGAMIDGSSIFNISTSNASTLANGTPVYIGLRFRNEGANLASAADDTVHFGWALVMMPPAGLTQDAVLISYAYETTPGLGIMIPTAAVPEPGTVLAGIGALGAGAVALRRRRAK